MPKFEVGDKVKIVALDTRWHAYVPCFDEYLGKICVVRRNEPDDKNEKDIVCVLSREDKSNLCGFCMPESWLELVEKKKPEYWTGQIVITDAGLSRFFTTGRVCEVKDGLLYDDTGNLYVRCKFESIDSIQKYLDDDAYGIKIIEFKGFANEEDE